MAAIPPTTVTVAVQLTVTDCVAWQPFGGKREELLQFKFDFARFKALNEGLMTPKYLDINLKPTLKWSGTQFFPRDGVVVDYQKIDDVFGAHPVFTVE